MQNPTGGGTGLRLSASTAGMVIRLVPHAMKQERIAMNIRSLLLAAVFCACVASAGDGRKTSPARNGARPTRARPVSFYTLKGANGLEARITNFGGRIVNLLVPNRQGGKTDVEAGVRRFRLLFPQGQHLWRPGRPLCRPHQPWRQLSAERQDLSAGKDRARRQIRHPWRHRRLFQQAVAGTDAGRRRAQPDPDVEQPRWRWRLSRRARHHRHLYR